MVACSHARTAETAVFSPAVRESVSTVVFPNKVENLDTIVVKLKLNAWNPVYDYHSTKLICYLYYQSYGGVSFLVEGRYCEPKAGAES